jgi:hypothetical protein
MPNHTTDGNGMIIRRLRPLTPVLRAILQLPVEKRTAFLQIVAARLRSSSSHFFDAGLDNAVRAVLWELTQEFGLLPGTIRWINVQMSAAGFNGPAGGDRSG